ncbi:DNA mismatch repair protein MutL [Thalassotalea sp. 42_200_T64]|nr:DNA mismatch repair protein MutL [Thalassotalea sp. 42_200_T64]
MSIAVLPARLANQIAAGEVVERPASVVKELVENSIDAGATKINIDIEKGGAKRIKISDNGKGIVKDELTLALSRHATSKIKNLDDLESIHSLGFRGEALASISSVARLTLTSKPAEQESAWQAVAFGRDMQVEVKPAAHPDGTTIDVEDLFFNTPARRKFLRTEKTEFTHIDEVVRRIALSKLQITIVLTHNGKVVRQYRSANTDKQIEKRIASVCGQSFIDNAIALEFQHDNLHLWGWIAKPQFFRSQNDLCYSYVNDRMMRDKLINHAIRQAYGERLNHEGYPAFVLFLNLDFSEVDVNVHPAKHEVRFHQARFVHDFICSAIEQTLSAEQANLAEQFQDAGEYRAESRDYVQPLTAINEQTQAFNQGERQQGHQPKQSSRYSTARPSTQALNNYQSLLTTQSAKSSPGQSYPDVVISQSAEQAMPVANVQSEQEPTTNLRLLKMVATDIALVEYQQQLCCLKLMPMLLQVIQWQLQQSFATGIVSQPLLLPVAVSVSDEQWQFIAKNEVSFNQAGIVLQLKAKQCIIREYPAQLRDKDINQSFSKLLSLLTAVDELDTSVWVNAFAQLKLPQTIDFIQAQQVLLNSSSLKNFDLSDYLRLNSRQVDLTSYIKQLQ